MKLFDTHFHLEPEDDLEAMYARATEAGVGWLLVAGASVGKLDDVLKRIAPYPNVYAAVGVHPHEAEEFDGDLAFYRQRAAQDQVKAIGEIGLDYFYDTAPRQEQRETLGHFLDLAAETGLPAIIHCREAEDDCFALLQDHLPQNHPFVVHCFTGTPQWAEKFLSIGGWLSFTGILTFNRADNVRDAISVVPLDRLMFETDSPYLAPVPKRGKRNEPAFVRHVVEYAADFLDLPLDELTETTTRNAFRFFQIEPQDAP